MTGIGIWALFTVGIATADMLAVLLTVIPLPRKWKKSVFRNWLHICCKWSLHLIPGVRYRRRGKALLTKPALIIAERESPLEALMLIALSPKIIIITRDSVFRNPFTGPVARFADYINEEAESIYAEIGKKIVRGLSVAVFLENHDSCGNDISFRKEAFKIAEHYNLELLPAVFYGTGHIFPNGRKLPYRPGLIVRKIYPRYAWDNSAFGSDADARSRAWSKWFKGERELLNIELCHPSSDISVRRALLSNYLPQGFGIWAVTAFECCRAGFWDSLVRYIPRNADIVDLGCGTGARALLLAMLGHSRQVLGVDESLDKIDIARNCPAVDFSCADAPANIEFECCKPEEWEMRNADIFIVGDIDPDGPLAEKCRTHLNEGGRILCPTGRGFKEL